MACCFSLAAFLVYFIVIGSLTFISVLFQVIVPGGAVFSCMFTSMGLGVPSLFLGLILVLCQLSMLCVQPVVNSIALPGYSTLTTRYPRTALLRCYPMSDHILLYRTLLSNMNKCYIATSNPS